MKTKNFLILLLCLFIAGHAEAQLLKKLKKKAEQAAERTILRKTDEVVTKKTEKTIDDITKGDEDDNNEEDVNNSKTEKTIKGSKFSNPSLDINTEAKKSHYASEVRVVSFDKEKQTEVVSYFDADEVAMKSNWVDGNSGKPKTSYADSEGFFISYNDTEKRFTKTALMSMPVMGMMAPSMMVSAYKLPESAIFGALEEMNAKKLKIYPFMHVDFPFVLKPDHYREEMNINRYKESKQSCRGSMGCTKFSVQEAGYEGSYTMFDNQDRLVEINIAMKDNPNFGSGKGKIEYFYEDINVKVPEAVEKKMPGQDLFNMGLDPNKN
jgi:hypothetical protein